MRTLVVIPTYNESPNIEAVIQQVLHLPRPISILVVDDGSPDGTADIVRRMQAENGERIFLIERAEKSGLGTAYLTGFRFALDRGFELICEMDADLSHNPQELVPLCDLVAHDEADLAIGSRYVNGVRIINWPLSRLILSYGASLYTRVITRMKIYDVTAGFKCFHRKVLEAIPFDRVKSNGYSFQIEMNYRAWKKGFRLKEHPIIFTERSEGLSKMNRHIVREAICKVWEIRFRSLIGRL